MKKKAKICSSCKQKIQYTSEPDLFCPKCNTKYWYMPEDEAILFALQDKYIESGRDSKYLGEMYLVLIEYSKNFIKNKMKNKFLVSQEYLEEKAIEITYKVINKYLENPNYVFKVSFGGMMKYIVLGVLWGSNKRKEDKIESLSKSIYKKDNTELEEILINDTLNWQNLEKSYEAIDNSSSSLYKEISYILDIIYNKIRNRDGEPNLYYLNGMLLFFNKKGDKFMRNYYDIAGNSVKKDIENAKLVIRNYLNEGASS